MMALERVPADIRKDGGVSRMSDPKVIIENLFFGWVGEEGSEFAFGSPPCSV